MALLKTVLDFLLDVYNLCIQNGHCSILLVFYLLPDKKKKKNKQKLYKICYIKHLNRGRTWVVIFFYQL